MARQFTASVQPSGIGAAKQPLFPREIAEAALAHVAGDATERAYRRGDALENRRGLMEAWAGD
jgi:hypothetical protein